MKIGDKIRSLRIIKGYSQENMADILGISSIAYGDIEVIRRCQPLKIGTNRQGFRHRFD